jgi:hypothetical protein
VRFQYKYIIMRTTRWDGDGDGDGDGRRVAVVVRWESDPNRFYAVPANCEGEAVESDVWR